MGVGKFCRMGTGMKLLGQYGDGKIYMEWRGSGKKSIRWAEDGYYSLFFTFSFVGSATKHRVTITTRSSADADNGLDAFSG